MSKKGQFNISINPHAENMMEALSIPQERCKELCGLVERVHGEHPDYNLGQILQEVSTHCESQNELIFMSYILGTRVGHQVGHLVATAESQLQSLFEELQNHHQQHDFSFN